MIGYIYIIQSNLSNRIYIGSTTRQLQFQLYIHKNNFKKWKDGRYLYFPSYDIVKYHDCYINELCKCKFESKLHMHIVEEEFKKHYNCDKFKIKYYCDCGSIIINKPKHQKSKKHQRLIL